MKPWFIVSATRGRKEDTTLWRSVQALEVEGYRFFENNTEGLSTCYNAVLDERAGRDEIIVFVHDDVLITDVFALDKLNAAITEQGFAVIGVAGSSEFNVDAGVDLLLWNGSKPEARSGSVEHFYQTGVYAFSAYGATPMSCVVLDGLFIAVDNARIGAVRFDPQFRFHFYDIDFCLAAHKAGLRLGTTNVHLTHKSVGVFQREKFVGPQDLFRAKWQPSQHVVAKKLRSNDICWCGSGLKYKHCHGRAG
jgi:hypothetical protein